MRALWIAALLAAADSQQWEQKEFDCDRPRSCDETKCCEYGLAVYTREKPGVDVKEVKAVGQVDAPPSRVFEVVTDYEHQVGNMPYVQDQAVFSRSDKEVVFWAGGVYRAAWEPTQVTGVPLPEDGVIRLKVNTGSWTMEPIDGGKRTMATYQLLTDPGGSIPTFIANKANTKALPELFSRVRKRAEAKQ